MVYSTAYPIYHIFESAAINTNINYTINIGDTIVFRGKVIAIDTNPTTIDISPVCREYLNTYYENTFGDGITLKSLDIHKLISSIWEFTVVVGSTVTPYTVMYNYNDDYRLIYPDNFNLNDPISTDADPRQFIGLSGYNVLGDNTFRRQLNTGLVTTNTLNSKLFQVNQGTVLDLYPTAQPGDTITLINNQNTFKYDIVSPCRNKFALYYVNKLGGLDYLLCSGRAIESFTGTNTDVRLYGDRLDRKQFERERLQTLIDKKYRLNTGFLTDHQASKIDNLVFSPKTWIHNLDEDTITSCLVSDTSATIRNFRNDQMTGFQFNVTESQQILRK